jgi:hypothetical protein
MSKSVATTPGPPPCRLRPPGVKGYSRSSCGRARLTYCSFRPYLSCSSRRPIKRYSSTAMTPPMFAAHSEWVIAWMIQPERRIRGTRQSRTRWRQPPERQDACAAPCPGRAADDAARLLPELRRQGALPDRHLGWLRPSHLRGAGAATARRQLHEEAALREAVEDRGGSPHSRPLVRRS